MMGIIRQMDDVLAIIPYLPELDDSELFAQRIINWLGDSWFSKSITMKVTDIINRLIENFCGLTISLDMENRRISYYPVNKNAITLG